MQSFYDGKPWINSYPEDMPRVIKYDQETPLDDFLRCYEEAPDNACIYYFDNTYTYREIMLLASSLAMTWDDYGVQEGDRILIQMQNIPQAVICFVAGWLRKLILVPLNPMYLHREMEHYVEDCHPKVICCQYDTYEAAIKPIKQKHPDIKVIVTSPQDMLRGEHSIPKQLTGLERRSYEDTNDFMECINNYKNPVINGSPGDPDQPACLIYTSGTTGPPKGAIISNANIGYNSRVYAQVCKLDADDVVLGVAPMFHVTGLVAHVGVALCVGMPIVMFHRFDIDDLARLTKKYQASFTVAAITVFIAILDRYGNDGRDYFKSLDTIYSGGAPIAPATAQKYKDAFGVQIHNVYGMTETTSPISMTPYLDKSPVDEESGAYSVGLIVPGYDVRIVDVGNKSKEVPLGDEGELAVRGPGVISGYWEKPEETANAIVDGELFSGDVAKMDQNGWLYIVDRKKDLINVSGYKVWPREVEDVIYQHPAIREAAVVSVDDDYRGETVKAFVSLKGDSNQKVTPEEIIQFCKERMAAYKYPRLVEVMEDLPKTPTGKILRRMLR